MSNSGYDWIPVLSYLFSYDIPSTFIRQE